MAPGKRKSPSSPGSRPPAPAAPESPRFLPCPTCGKSFVARFVQEHAWSCTAGAPSNNEDTGGDRKSDDGKFVNCPVCSRSFPQHAIENHAWGCVPPTRQQQCLTDSLEGAPADQRSPVGAGKEAKPGETDQSPGRLADKRRSSSSLISRGSKVNLFSTASSAGSSAPNVLLPKREMTVPCGHQQGDAVQVSGSRVSH